ncbi:MAG TPA: biliverdin-producing heme oxygenase [Fimbriimonadaceae bacterium]
MATLRGATRKAHDRFDIAVDLDGLLKSRERYRDLLARLFGFYAPLEATLFDGMDSFAEAGLDLNDRRKSSALLLDLVSLGYTKSQLDAIELCNDLPEIGSPEQTLGAIYVLEEATIGGQFICQLLNQRLGITTEAGGRFFNGYANDTGLMWRRYCETLETIIVTPEQRWDLVDGALSTFAKLQKWVEFQEVPRCANLQ